MATNSRGNDERESKRVCGDSNDKDSGNHKEAMIRSWQ